MTANRVEPRVTLVPMYTMYIGTRVFFIEKAMLMTIVDFAPLLNGAEGARLL
ncbi:hypothetical protein QYG89_01640 [Bacillus sp. B190/17]|uniref:Uncharacterized protein n=1 Tax=Bacillus lumedeiriae TaxID=3058829 RepID=A0ABW8I4K1_9BACI